MSSETVVVYDLEGNPHEMSRASALIQVASGKATFEKVNPVESAVRADVETATEQSAPKPRKAKAKKAK